MFKRMCIPAIVALAMVIGGCGKSHESIRKDAMGKMKDMVDVLKTVKDDASAKAAATKLKEITADIKKLKEQDDALGKLSKEEEQKLDKQMEPEMKPIQDQMTAEMKRIAQLNPALMMPLMDAMKDMANMK
jgi:hypothetical protein